LQLKGSGRNSLLQVTADTCWWSISTVRESAGICSSKEAAELPTPGNILHMLEEYRYVSDEYWELQLKGSGLANIPKDQCSGSALVSYIFFF
jgi:hypothetical protein